MILQALTRYYEDMQASGRIARPGWGTAKVTFGLDLSRSGELIALLWLETEQMQGKKSRMAPQTLPVPMPVKRTVGVASNFLCDNSSYLLGVDGKGNPARAADCFSKAKELHLSLLENVSTPAAQAVCAFFRSWDPAAAAASPILAERWEDLMKGGNLLLYCEETPVTEDPAICAAWQKHYDSTGDGPLMCCLVTGEEGPVESVHPAIKGVLGAQSSGAALVSFNAPAFCSYDKEQNTNAPVGSYATFAYTTALNTLLADNKHRRVLGDTTVLCWAEGGEPAYQSLGMAALMGLPEDNRLKTELPAVVKALARGETTRWDGTELHPGTRFYVLGLAPNAARLAVRFFYQNTFGELLRHVQQHQDRLEIAGTPPGKAGQLSVPALTWETVNRSARSPSPAPQMAGDTLRAILTGGRYPATLLEGVMLRIRAERAISYARAAIIKAYYLKNEHVLCPKEVLTVQLNEDSNHIPYVLGRLFSVLEAIQEAANPGINATIRDKFFNAASATPASVFPTLVNLAQKHLRKMETGRRVWYQKQLGELMDKLGESYPTRLTLPEQGAFQLGYYQQTQKRYVKKEETKNV